MSRSSTVKTENLKPFKKGKDERRNPTGALSREAAAFSMKFRNALAKKMSPEDVADILINEVKKKKPWAIQEFLDRLMGKSTQPIEHSGNVGIPVFKMPRPKKGSGAKDDTS